MALILEDGTGVTGANSYASLVEALAYHADHGNLTWATSTDPLRTAALIRGSAAIDGIFGGRWQGTRMLEDQGLDWPRVGAYDRDGFYLDDLPDAVKNMAMEAAIVELDNPGALSQKATTGLSEQTIGLITQKWKGSSGANATAYPAIFQAGSRILGNNGANIALVR
jgi:hypothetical protein